MDAAQEVKSRLDVADIVGEYLTLKPAGSGSFRALCPFHGEKTPSFYVNRPRQSWHCFGCNKGGDILSFVMDMEGMGFREALELLAQKAGVTLPERSPADMQRAGERKRLQEVNELAARFFRAVLLQSPDAAHARAYATKRNVDELTGDIFKIGYAPKSWDALSNALKGKGVTDEELLRAGLAAKRENGSGVYDRFRDRLMFAIQDVHGNVVGFTGRLLDEQAKEAKYVNTPETAAYKKSAILYGLDKAKGEIKRQNVAVIVEGNMDVVSSHRAGITNVVCSSGTALTDEQLHLLNRFTTNLAIAFDADAAGKAATLRGLDLARARDFNVKIITLPPEAGKDPDDAVNKNPDLWKQAISTAADIMDWVFRSAFAGKDLSNPDHKKKIAADVLPEIRRIADPVVRDHWIKKLADGLGIGEDALREAIKRAAIGGPGYEPSGRRAQGAGTDHQTGSDTEKSQQKQADRGRDLSERILSVFIARPGLIEKGDDALPSDLPEDLSTLYRSLKRSYDSARSIENVDSAKITSEMLTSALDEQESRLVDYLVIRADRDFRDQSAAALTQEYEQSRLFLRQFQNAKTRQGLEEAMRAAELSGDHARIAELSKAFADLTKSG